MIKMKLAAAALLLAVPFGAGAQAGYVDVAKLGIPADVKPEVEVFLEKPLLKMLAGAAYEVAPQLAEIAEGLTLVQVKVYESVDASNADANVQDKATALLDNMFAEGWKPIVRVPEDGVNFVMKTDGDYITGLFGLIVDGGEIVFINLVGHLEPMTTGQLLGQIGMSVMKGQTDMQSLMGLVMGGAMGDSMGHGHASETVEVEVEKTDIKQDSSAPAASLGN